MEKALIKSLYRETSAFMGKKIEISGWVRKIRVSRDLDLLKLMMEVFLKEFK